MTSCGRVLPSPLRGRPGPRRCGPAPVGGCALEGEWRSRRGALSRPAQAGCLLIPAGALAGLGCGPASLGARPDVLMGVQHRGALPPVSTWAGAVVPSPGRSARRARTPEAWTWRGAAADFPETAGAGVKRWGQPAGRTPGQGGVGVYSFRPLDPACARWPRPLPDAESRTRLWHVWPVRAVTQWQWRLEGKAVLKQCSS
jgi:hypothetical protein